MNRAMSLRPWTAALAGLALVATALFAPAAAAGQTPDRTGWETGYHIVRPGDTLESLAARYLGDSELWHELHKLNPQLTDPHRIYPGQRIQVYHRPPTRQPTAQIEAIANRVEERPQPTNWRPAGLSDLLLEKDSLRTYTDGSARIRFDDGGAVTMTEDSLIFLRRQTPPAAQAPAKKEIEILVGQAEVASTRDAVRAADIEVVVGSTKATGVAAPDQPLRTRARRTESEAAQIMQYEGETTVASGGAQVALTAGTGTTVEPRKAPGPVETLLAAPTLVAPAERAELERADAVLRWSPVAGAASYVVETCADANCGALVERVDGLTGTEVQLTQTAGSDTYFRVTAVSASGLDGFPSEARSFRLVDSLAPGTPLVLLTVDGVDAAADGCVPKAPEVRVKPSATGSKVVAWRLFLDGKEVSEADLENLGDYAGEHTVMARVLDDRGRIADSAPMTFLIDPVAPWGTIFSKESVPPDADTGLEDRRRQKVKLSFAPPSNCGDIGFEIEGADNVVVPVPCGPGVEPVGVAVEGKSVQVALRAAKPLQLGERVSLGTGEPALLDVWDEGCGLASLAIRIVPSKYSPGRLLLEVQTSDVAGNQRTLGWHADQRVFDK